MKKIISSLLALCTIASSAVSVIAKSTIFYDGEKEAFYNGEFVNLLDSEGITPMVIDGTFYIPLRAFVELNNGNVVWKKNGEKVSVDFAVGSYYSLDSGTSKLKKYDGSEQNLDKETFLNKEYNRLMVPADMFEKIGYKIVQGSDYLGVYSDSGEKKNVIVMPENSGEVNSVEVNYSLLNDEGEVFVSNIQNLGEIINSTAGKVGFPIEAEIAGGAIDEAEIVFNYDENALGNINESDLKIAWYNEWEGKMELLENSVADVENNKVTVKTSHFSQYVLVDSKAWYDAWAKSQLIVRDKSNTSEYFNVVFLLDTSGSMSDSIDLLKKAVRGFINELYPEDMVSVVKFDSTAEVLMSNTNKKDVTEDKLNEVIKGIYARGSTNMKDGFENAADKAFVLDTDTYNSIIIFLSDGHPDSGASITDEMLETEKDRGVRVLSLALGNGADTELMKNAAEKTNGVYKYIKSANDLEEVFEMLRGEVIGVDKDSDGDGIPDLIEKTGMRDQAGKIFITDPNNADTDGDGIPDGEEMGVFVENGNASYFRRKSDPTLKTSYSDKAKITMSEPNIIGVDDDKFRFKCGVSIAERELNDDGEIIYADAKGILARVIVPDCLDYNLTVYHKDGIPVSGMSNVFDDGSGIKIGDWKKGNYNYSQEFTCLNKGIECENEHKVEVQLIGENFDECKAETVVDLKDLAEKRKEAELQKAIAAWGNVTKEIEKDGKGKIKKELYQLEKDKENEYRKSLDKIDFNPLDWGNAWSKERTEAVKIAIMTIMSDDAEGLKKFSSSPVQIVKDSWAILGNISKKNPRIYETKVDGNEYEIRLWGYLPKIKDGKKLPYLEGVCEDPDGSEHEFVYTSNLEDINDFVTAYNELLKELEDDIKKDTVKKVYKELCGPWFKALDALEEDALKQTGMLEFVQAWKAGNDIAGQLANVYNTDKHTPGESKKLIEKIEKYSKDYGEGTTGVLSSASKKVIDNLLDKLYDALNK